MRIIVHKNVNDRAQQQTASTTTTSANANSNSNSTANASEGLCTTVNPKPKINSSEKRLSDGRVKGSEKRFSDGRPKEKRYCEGISATTDDGYNSSDERTRPLPKKSELGPSKKEEPVDMIYFNKEQQFEETLKKKKD